MEQSITRRYSFEAAHFLPYVPDYHKCKRMHGHNYEIEVTVAGAVGSDGFIIDFWNLDKIVHPIIEAVDHRVLNEIPGLENPTAENISVWFAGQLSPMVKKIQGSTVSMVRVYETKDCWADVIL